MRMHSNKDVARGYVTKNLEMSGGNSGAPIVYELGKVSAISIEVCENWIVWVGQASEI